MSMPDAVLLERWQRRRDADAFTELVQRHSGMVMSCCKRMLGDQTLAEDVAQECFVALLQSSEGVRASLGAWLHTIAVRRSIDHIKSDVRRRKREASFARSQGDAVTTDVPVDEILNYVDEAIDGLPDGLRAAVVGRFLENQTHTDLARHLSVAESTVRYRIEKGVDRIREQLRKQGIAVGAATLTAALSQPVEAAPAALMVKLGKLAVSGSVAAPKVATAATAITLKIAVAVLATVAIGAGLWVSARSRWQDPSASSTTSAESSPGATSTSPAPAERVPAAPSQPATGKTPSAVPAVAPAAEATELEPFSIEGRVYDAATGEGIAGARVQVYPAGGGREAGRSEPTGEDGRYRIEPIDDGMYDVRVEEIDAYPDVRRSGGVSITLKNREPVTGIDFALKKGIPVAGRVVGPDGLPIPKAEVAAATPATPNPVKAQSGERGQFTLYMPDLSDNLSLQAQNDGAESAVHDGIALTEAGADGISLVLDRPKTASIGGVVVDGTGAPMEGAQLHLWRKDPSVFHWGNSGNTDRKGQFKIAGLPGAEYGVIVTPKGVDGFSTSEEYLRVKLAAGERRDGIEIVYGEKGGLAIAGRVVNSKGEPVAGARVQCFADTMENAHTDKDGAFMITGLENKTYAIAVEHNNYSRTHGSFAAGTMDAEIVLKGRGRLAGRVVRADSGAPLPVFTLAYLMGEAREFDEMLFSSGNPVESADGTFSIGQTQAGRFTVAAWAPGFAPELQLVDVEEDEAVNVEFRLTAAPPYEGTVVNEAGEPIANAAVYFVTGVSLDRIDRAAAAHSDVQGRFVLESLPADATQLCAYRPGYGVGVISLPGESQIVLPEPAVVTGTIQFDGVAMSDLFINAYYPGARHLPGTHRKPEPDGSFKLSDLSEGLLCINAMPNGPGNQRSVTKTVELERGQTSHVAIVFDRGTAVVEGMLTVEGAPVESAFLALGRQIGGDTTESIRATLGTDGSYRFEEVWSGNLVLSISRVNPDNPYEPIMHEIDLAVADGQVLRQDVELPPLPNENR